MNSSNMKVDHNLANEKPEKMLQALTELANLRNDVAAYRRFLTHWPGYVPLKKNMYRITAGERVPFDLVDALEERRAALRNIWEGDATTLVAFLLPTEPPDEIRGEYFDKSLGPDEEQSGTKFWDTQVGLDWQRGQFTYDPKTKFQQALYQLFRNAAWAKVCANPDCSAPYFIADKVNQRYCSDACAKVFQQEWKRRWWTEHGDTWRRARKNLKRKPGGKR